MKPYLQLNLGRETTENEVEEILSAFSPHFEVTYEKNYIRLSEDWIPLVINFTVAAVGGGIIYDALKGALNLLREKFVSKKLARSPAAIIRIKNETYIVSEEKIFLQSVDTQLDFRSVDEFIEYLENTRRMG